MLRTFVAALLVTSAVPAVAANSRPQPVPYPDSIPAPQDRAYPGTIKLRIDATDTDHGIIDVRETVPVAQSGPLTLLIPKWIPGEHGPSGVASKVAGIAVSANGKPLAWTRDTVDVFAIHVDVPDRVSSIDIAFKYLTPTSENQGRIVMTPVMETVEFKGASFYPAGYFTRGIQVEPTVTFPPGWQTASALRASTTRGSTTTYGAVDYDTLIDSPIIAGKYMRRDDLGHAVMLNTIADRPSQLVVAPEVLQLHKNLADQAVKLFGGRHFDHYDFLFSLSDRMGGEGLEHHRSSENGVGADYFTDWKASLSDHNLLPHEFTHSWDGKFRRPADLWTPNYNVPMRDSLMWVYEGQTQFWGYVLEARSGLATKQQILDAYASIAANLDTLPGRKWRPLQDTTNDPIIAARRPAPWRSYQRSEDYYNEGLLIWVEADGVIREGARGQKGLDDFARAFFGVNDGDWGELTYTFDDVVRTLNGVMPYDWAGWLRTRLDRTSDRAPLAGFEKSGYRLVYTEKPSSFTEVVQKARKIQDLTYSLGLSIGKEAKIGTVQWDGPAFKAGLTVGQQILAVNGATYSDEIVKEAITAAKGGSAPIRLTIKDDDRVRDVDVRWNGGLRYPHFEKAAGAGEGALDKLLAAR